MKKECEVIEDLLLGYSDGTLNAESKKLVEEHLKVCDECRKKLETIKKENDIAKDEVKVLRYFKKFRKKNILKLIFYVFGIFILIILGIYLRKVFIISKIQNKIEELYGSNNLYSEQISLMNDGKSSVARKYYKDKKAKDVTSFYSNSGEFIFMTNYYELEKNKMITVMNYANTYGVEENKKMNESSLKTFYLDLYDAFLTSKFEIAFSMDIDVIENVWGRYYVFTEAEDKSKSYELWVDADTLLPARTIEKEARITFYEGTEIVKEISDEITLYNYSFDTVTDKDVEIDLTNMKQTEDM